MSTSMEEAGDKCFGQECCEECPFYMDDCDGKEDMKRKTECNYHNDRFMSEDGHCLKCEKIASDLHPTE